MRAIAPAAATAHMPVKAEELTAGVCGAVCVTAQPLMYKNYWMHVRTLDARQRKMAVRNFASSEL
uniref:Uncharacterized protein n=1 Tax=Peronospora matthiolae TaxID=2874970 RepID=A0AAV1TDX6_9STRA